MQAQGRQPGVGRTTSLSACKRSRAVKPAIASIWDEAHLSVLNVRASSSPRFVRKLKKSATHETFNRDPTRFWNSSTSRCQQTCLRNRNAAGRENIVMIALVAQVPRTYLRPQSRHFLSTRPVCFPLSYVYSEILDCAGLLLNRGVQLPHPESTEGSRAMKRPSVCCDFR